MAASDTVDPYIVTALKLLHSSAPDSAEKMRLMLDNEILKVSDKSYEYFSLEYNKFSAILIF